MDSKSSRRKFIKNSATLAGLAVGTGINYRAVAQVPAPDHVLAEKYPDEWYDYGVRSRYVKSKRIGTNGTRGIDSRPGVPRDYGFRTPLQDTYGIVTPSSLHFVINHGHNPPDIDPQQHRLMIHGLVDKPLFFSMEDLHRLPSVSRFHFVECAGNSTPSGQGFAPGLARTLPSANVQVTHGLASCSEWTGVPLSTLLEKTGLKKQATWIVAEGAEEGMHTKSIPIGKALDDTLIVFGQNGEPLRPEQGFPLRLLTPGYEGISNVKWLRRIKVVDEPYMGMMESTRYTSIRTDGKSRWFQFELGPKSVIIRPSGGQRLSSPGFHEITGLAWSGGGAIRKIEVSVDSGQTWKDAIIDGPVYSKSFTRFRLPWNWNGAETILMSRCTDERGDVQPSVADLNKFFGISISLDFFKENPSTITHFNAIQSWKILSNGEVLNALFA